MSEHLSLHGGRIAPPDDLVLSDRDKLRVAFLDVIEDECLGLGKRGRLEERKVASFARDLIETLVKSANMLSGDWQDADSGGERAELSGVDRMGGSKTGPRVIRARVRHRLPHR
jgi:hypothetical protein